MKSLNIDENELMSNGINIILGVDDKLDEIFKDKSVLKIKWTLINYINRLEEVSFIRR